MLSGGALSGEAYAQFSPSGRKRPAPAAGKPAPSSPPRGSRAPATTSEAPPQASATRARPAASANEVRGAFPEGLYASLLRTPQDSVVLKKLVETLRDHDPNLKGLTERLERDLRGTDLDRRYAAEILFGRLEWMKGDKESARSWFEKAKASAPERLDAHVLLAELDPVAARSVLDGARGTVRPVERGELLRRLRELALAHGDDAGAAGYQSELTRIEPREAWSLGDTYRDRGALEQARTAYEVALSEAQEAEIVAPLRLRLAAVLLELGDDQRAREELERARALGRFDPEIERELFRLEIERARSERRLEALAQAACREKSDNQTLSYLARALETEGLSALALTCHRRAMALAPADVELARGFAEFLERAGDLRGARDAYQALLRLNPGDLGASVRVLELMGALGERERLEQEFQRALMRLSTADEKLTIVDLCLSSLDGPACERLEKSLLQKTQDRGLLYELGSRRYLAGDQALAKEAWLKARGPNPDGPALSRYADVLIDHELIEEGLLAHDKARARAPSDPKVLRARALALSRTMTLERSHEAQRRALAIGAWLELALDSKLKGNERAEAARHVVRLWSRAQVLEGETERLREQYESGRVDRAHAELLLEALEALGRAEEADQILTALIQKSPFDQGLQARKTRAGRRDGGAALASSLPAESEAATLRLREVAKNSLLRGQMAEALEASEALLRAAPRDVSALLLRAEALEGLGRAKEALESVETAFRLEPRRSAVLLKKAALLLQEGRVREAAQLYLNVLTVSKSPEEFAAASDALLLLRSKAGSDATQILLSVEEQTVRAFSARPDHPGYRALILALYESLFPPEALVREHRMVETQAARGRARMPLLTILARGTEEERARAARILSRVGGTESVRALLDYALSGAPHEVTCPLIERVGSSGDEEALLALLDVSRDSDSYAPRIRISLALGLAKVSDPRTTRALGALRSSKVPALETIAWLALGARGEATPSSDDPLPLAPTSRASQFLALGAPGRFAEKNEVPVVRAAHLVGLGLSEARERLSASRGGQGDGLRPELRKAIAVAALDPEPLLQRAAHRALGVALGADFGLWLPESLCDGSPDLEGWLEELVSRRTETPEDAYELVRAELKTVLRARLSEDTPLREVALRRLSRRFKGLPPWPRGLKRALVEELKGELEPLTMSPEASLRGAALDALPFPTAELPVARKALHEMLFGPSLELATLAAQRIVEEGDAESRMWLRRALSERRSWAFQKRVEEMESSLRPSR